MNNILLTLSIFLLGFNLTYSQNKTETEKHKVELRKVLDTFMSSLKAKDSTSLYNLFYDGPVTWVGVYKDKTQQKRIEKDPKSSDHKLADYKSWFRSTTKGSVKEEKFSNVNIDTDGSIASVTFDFSFWAGGKKGLWGKESWGLVKIKNEWKITSVIFSMEQESISPEPQRE
ncbi:nuclear transport factor 2 family protein [Chryseobacterium sp. OSA05B]|uniref:nuclear transport factor 2 family protein n=1 Tax=Chryseobacterium sp. OSA05B TaxID=2862650 RepID=UPI001CBFED0A|nr:nuclear transport factor 2 family protein [Chryseobacterium sp. OSA05B]